MRRSQCRAAAQAGKSVLHLDPAGTYGAHWASRRLDGFLDWASAQQRRQQGRSSGGGGADVAGGAATAAQNTAAQPDTPAASEASQPSGAAAAEVAVPAGGAAVYSHVTVRQAANADAELGSPREYNIDLAAKVRLYNATVAETRAQRLEHAADPVHGAGNWGGNGLMQASVVCLVPQAALCAGPLVKALLASGAHNYVEFKALSSRCGDLSVRFQISDCRAAADAGRAHLRQLQGPEQQVGVFERTQSSMIAFR